METKETLNARDSPPRRKAFWILIEGTVGMKKKLR